MRTIKQVAEYARSLSREQFIAALMAAGYRKLGGGYFSETYGRKRSRFVVKVGETGKAHRDGYVAYVEWLEIGQRCGNPETLLPSLPRVYAAIRRGDEKQGTDYHVTILERLNGLVRGDPILSDKAKNLAGALEAYSTRPDRPELLSEPQRQMLRNMPYDVLRAGQLIVEKFGDAWNTDMHAGNFMRRGRSQVVYTDPLSHPR